MNRKQLLPNIFTAINLLIGFISILIIINGELIQGAWFILLCLLMDGLDGKVARMTKGYSLFGANFDSLSDLVSFGVAPALLIYFATLKMYNNSITAMIIPFLFVLSGAIRLARFNANLGKLEEKGNFTGLPIPIAAIIISTYFIFINKLEINTLGINALSLFILSALGLLNSFFMISNIRFLNFNSLLRNIYRNKLLLTIILALVVLAIIIPHFVFFPVFVIYLFYGIIWHVFGLYKNINEKEINTEAKTEIEKKEKV